MQGAMSKNGVMATKLIISKEAQGAQNVQTNMGPIVGSTKSLIQAIKRKKRENP